MKDADQLPQSKRFVSPGQFGFRFPTLADMMELRWAVEWDETTAADTYGARAANGVLGFRDHYDFHSASDVREIAYVAGSARAIVRLFRWAKCDAALLTRRIIGSFDSENKEMKRLVERLGAVSTRAVFEAV